MTCLRRGTAVGDSNRLSLTWRGSAKRVAKSGDRPSFSHHALRSYTITQMYFGIVSRVCVCVCVCVSSGGVKQVKVCFAVWARQAKTVVMVKY